MSKACLHEVAGMLPNCLFMLSVTEHASHRLAAAIEIIALLHWHDAWHVSDACSSTSSAAVADTRAGR